MNNISHNSLHKKLDVNVGHHTHSSEGVGKVCRNYKLIGIHYTRNWMLTLDTTPTLLRVWGRCVVTTS